MTNENRSIASVIGPNGDVLTEADLPPRNTARWVPRRKAEIVAAVNGGLLSLMDACQRYQISHEEFRDWVSAYERNGLLGLRARRSRRGLATSPSADTLSLAPDASPGGRFN